MTTISAWEDDPFGAVAGSPPPANKPLSQTAPNFNAPRLKVGVSGPQPAPGAYPVGTREFRYWALADAMVRGATYWSGRVPTTTTWQPQNGPVLVAGPDDGVDLNAYYNRQGLHFFHGSVHGTTIYSGESPDVVCHELGHAVLDAVKPQLWNAASAEVGAFHESFGDCSAILSNLQVKSLRQAVLTETDGRVWVASRLSRLAESLGWAIRQLVPDAVEPDCLRSAVNSFYYQDPASLPPRTPASSLSSEPHSFSRVFTGGFLRVLGLMFRLQGAPTESALLSAANDAGTLLIEGVRRSPVVPGFMAQVTAHMVAADADLFGGKYRQAILSGFVSFGVLSVSSASRLAAESRLAAMAEIGGAAEDEALPSLTLSGTSYGLPRDLLVAGAAQTRRVEVAGGLPDAGDATPPAPESAAASFVEDLLRLGRISGGDEDLGTAPIVPSRFTTHEIVREDGLFELRRTRFACGFGLH